MQTSKISLLICAAAICVSPLFVRAEDAEVQAKLRAALRERMAELSAQKQSNTTPTPAEMPIKAAQPVEPAKPAVVVEQPKAPAKPVVEKPAMTEVKPVNAGRAAAEKEAMKQAAEKEKAKEAKAKAKSATKDSVAQPVVSPDLPISADKQMRLNALTEQYKADKLTPQEYHEQRAKILAEP
jgi:hypothetical protein